MRNDLQLTPWVISSRNPGWVDDFARASFSLVTGG